MHALRRSEGHSKADRPWVGGVWFGLDYPILELVRWLGLWRFKVEEMQGWRHEWMNYSNVEMNAFDECAGGGERKSGIDAHEDEECME